MMRLNFAAALGLLASAMITSGSEAQSQERGQPKVAVYNFRDPQASGQAVTLKDMITTAIINTGKFTVISRDLDSAEAEAQLSRAGKTRGGRAATVKADTFDYSIEGSITSVQGGTRVDNTAGTVGGALGLPFLKGCSKEVVSISIDVTIKDIATQQTPYAAPLTRREQTKCNQSGEQVDVPFLMRAIANDLARDFATKIYPIRVVAVQPDGSVIFNYGSSVLPEGIYLQLTSPSQQMLVDGKMSDIAGSPIGRVRITNANEDTARGVFEGPGPSQIAVGATGKIDLYQEPAKPGKKKKS